MELSQVQVPQDDVGGFFSKFLSEPTGQPQPTQNQQDPQGTPASPTPEGSTPAADPKATDGGEKTVEEVITGSAKPDEKPKFFSDPKELADKLIEEKILYPYEDGTKPETTEQILDSIKQSSLYNAETRAQELYDNRISTLSPALQTILQYGDNGVTSASQLTEFVGKVSHFEKVASLDPTKAEDQEQIVFMQLVNSGMDEAGARVEIADLKERSKLATAAEKYLPVLKNAYQNQITSMYEQKQREVEETDQWLNNNAKYVGHFLENEEKFVSFKIPKKDKATVFSLGAQPVGFDPEGNPVFGWQQYIQNLQEGTEDQFKEYMKIMSFLANSKGYEESVGKVKTNNSKIDSFKKINTGGKSNSAESNEERTPTIRKPSNNAWAVNG